MDLFREVIRGWDDWANVSGSVLLFSPLIGEIGRRHALPAREIEGSMAATNAIFKAGDQVFKIYAPAVTGVDGPSDMETERRVSRAMRDLGIEAPCILAHGVIEDRYDFAYVVMEYIEGTPFRQVRKAMTDGEKERIGRQLREITDRIHAPDANFAAGNIWDEVEKQSRWENYSERFQAERQDYIRAHRYGELVPVHGDLSGDNILVRRDETLCLIDFAEAIRAPEVYEDAYIAAELFDFDPSCLRGYFANIDAETLTQMTFDGLLIHDFGGDVIRRHLGAYEDFRSLGDLKRRLRESFREMV